MRIDHVGEPFGHGAENLSSSLGANHSSHDVAVLIESAPQNQCCGRQLNSPGRTPAFSALLQRCTSPSTSTIVERLTSPPTPECAMLSLVVSSAAHSWNAMRSWAFTSAVAALTLRFSTLPAKSDILSTASQLRLSFRTTHPFSVAASLRRMSVFASCPTIASGKPICFIVLLFF